MTSFHDRRDQLLEEYYRLIGKGNMKAASLLMAELFMLLSERFDDVRALPTNGVGSFDNCTYQAHSDYLPGAPFVEHSAAPAPLDGRDQLDLFGETAAEIAAPEDAFPATERLNKLGRRIGVPGVIRPRLRK